MYPSDSNLIVQKTSRDAVAGPVPWNQNRG